MVNKKTVWGVTNIALRLLVICLAVAALTALVYGVTKDPIADGERKSKEAAIRNIFADYGSSEEIELAADGFQAVYAVYDASAAHIGWCVDYVGTSDYGGDVSMMIGVGTDGRVNGVQVINHAETFIDRYLDGKNCYTGIGQPHGADLSAGATMSYNAIRNAITAVEERFATELGAPAPAPVTARFERDDVTLLFAGAADWSEEVAVEASRVNGVRRVKNGDGTVLGHAVHYSATGGYYGGAEMLLSVDTAGEISVLLLDYADDRMSLYLDEQDRYNGADAEAMASKSYQMIRSAISAVEALQLGGAV